VFFWVCDEDAKRLAIGDHNKKIGNGLMRRKFGISLTGKFFEILVCIYFGVWLIWSERITVRENRRTVAVDTLYSGTMTYITQYAVWHACNTL
jgi:hypothetical protein